MDISSVPLLKQHLNVESDTELAKALADLGILRTGTRQTIYLWGGLVPQYVQDAIELRQYRASSESVE